jgi:hypothetical protein
LKGGGDFKPDEIIRVDEATDTIAVCDRELTLADYCQQNIA